MICRCGRDAYLPEDGEVAPHGLFLCEGCDNVAEDACTCDPLD